MTRPSLFDDEPEFPPAQQHSPTSREAAGRIAPVTGELRRRVYDFIRERGQEGATDEEMQVALDMGPSTQRPRRVELVRGGFVIDSGRTRLTKSGRKAVVWIVANKEKRNES